MVFKGQGSLWLMPALRKRGIPGATSPLVSGPFLSRPCVLVGGVPSCSCPPWPLLHPGTALPRECSLCVPVGEAGAGLLPLDDMGPRR